jgi:hypothetical protein
MGTLEVSYFPSLEGEIHLPYLLHPSPRKGIQWGGASAICRLEEGI